MRAEGERQLQGDPQFVSVNGSAEKTTLPDSSVNLITVFQAFHWFNRSETKSEFNRILKEPKWVLIIWNSRLTDESEFHREYELLLLTLKDYRNVNHRNISQGEIKNFIGGDEILTASFPNKQMFDFEGLHGRFFSSSYTPVVGSEAYTKYNNELKQLFIKHNKNGYIEMQYRTEVYLGKLRL